MKTENDMKIMETDPNAAVTGCKFRPQNRIPMNADRSAVICVVFFEEEGSRRRVFELKKKAREREISPPYIGKKCGKSIRCYNCTDHTNCTLHHHLLFTAHFLLRIAKHSMYDIF